MEGSVLCVDVICKSKRVCEPYIDCPKYWLYTILSISFASAVLNKVGYTVNSLKADSPLRRRRTASGWSRPGRLAICATLGLACSQARFSIVSLHSLVFFCLVPHKGKNCGHLATRTSRHYQVTSLWVLLPRLLRRKYISSCLFVFVLLVVSCLERGISLFVSLLE